MTEKPQLKFVNLLPGDPAPWFRQSTSENPRFVFDSVAGRYIVLCFFGSGETPGAKSALAALTANRRIFDDERMSAFGVSVDARDETAGRLKANLPGIRFFADFDQSVSRLYGAAPTQSKPGPEVALQQFWIVLDPLLRVMRTFPIAASAEVFDYLSKLPHPDLHVGYEVGAPILILPRVFEPEFCRKLIERYDAAGGQDSGFMREIEGKTVQVMDHGFKRRSDYFVEDAETMSAIQARIQRRVSPELAKVYCFNATRMERYLVGCYAQEDGGHFRPHRDNTTKGTAHRRFAVSINLNDDFDGGELSFPEFGQRSYKAPPGAALIFPGALLHAVSKVTRGKRYAFLPFVYDEAAAKLREENAKFTEGDAANYKSN